MPDSLKGGGCLLKEPVVLIRQEMEQIAHLEDNFGIWDMKFAVGNQLNATQPSLPVDPHMILVEVQPTIGLLLSIAGRMFGTWASAMAVCTAPLKLILFGSAVFSGNKNILLSNSGNWCPYGVHKIAKMA
jgi:hypothetical protein